MKIKTVVSALMAISLATGGVAFAQGRGNQNDRDQNDRNRNEQSRDQNDRNRNQQARDQNDRNNGRQADRPGNYSREGRGAGPNHEYYKGGRMPAQYRSHQYVVDDWRGHHLSAPPRGYHWVQTGGDFVLVAIASGIILQLLLNN